MGSPLTKFLEVNLGDGVRSHRGGKHLPRYRKPVDNEAQKFRVERARYARTEDGFRRWAQEHLRALYDGTVAVTTFYREFSEELYRYHVRMYVLGRRAAGWHHNTLDESEQRMLHGLHSQEMKYFSAFMRDYVTGGGKMPLNQRIDLYALGGYESYVRGAVKASGHDRWGWAVNPEAEHCDDCLEREKKSKEQGGFTVAELDGWVGYPGQKTQCMHRCRCHLYRIGAKKYQIPRTRPTAYKALSSKRIGTWKRKQKEKARATEKTKV